MDKFYKKESIAIVITLVLMSFLIAYAASAPAPQVTAGVVATYLFFRLLADFIDSFV